MKIGNKMLHSAKIFLYSGKLPQTQGKTKSDILSPLTMRKVNKFSLPQTRSFTQRSPSKYFVFLLFYFISLWLVFLSCAHPPQVYLRPEIKIHEFKTIAVLPFDNFSEEDGAGEKVTEIFTLELMRSGKFSLIEPGQVTKAIMEKRIRANRDIDLDAVKWLKDKLNSDMIMLGTVLDFQMQKFDNKEVPVVTVISRLVQTSTGATVWAAYQSRRGNDKETFFGWGRITSLSQLTNAVASEMIESLNK